MPSSNEFDRVQEWEEEGVGAMEGRGRVAKEGKVRLARASSFSLPGEEEGSQVKAMVGGLNKLKSRSVYKLSEMSQGGGAHLKSNLLQLR